MGEHKDFSETQVSFGRAAYEAYADVRGWKAYNDTQIPQWDEVNQGIRDGWIVAADVVLRRAGVDPSVVEFTAG